MRIELRPGEILEIVLAETDGLFVVDFDSNGDSRLTISADMADTSGRVGIIYEEDFAADFMAKCFPEKVAVYDSLRDGPKVSALHEALVSSGTGSMNTPTYEFASWEEGPITLDLRDVTLVECGSTSRDPEPDSNL